MAERKHLWLLSEERPKIGTIERILEKFAADRGIGCFVDTIRILPVIEGGRFAFVYEVIGFRCDIADRVFLKTISGYSSCVDYLVFHQHEAPNAADTPLYFVEETKTDDSESRNTGIYQRAAKFVYIGERRFAGSRKIMLYNIRREQKKTPSQTNVFGTRMLITLGVTILGKPLDEKTFKPFKSVDELIRAKRRMPPPRGGNVPLTIRKNRRASICITGRLAKSGYLAHDPNIGAISLIAATLRTLGWSGGIIIQKHGLQQRHLTPKNKFVKMANDLNLTIDGLALPKSEGKQEYWRYEREGEKLATIFVHLIVENFTCGRTLFENHAGCERGYFVTACGEHIPLKKYTSREAYKSGDKTKIVYLPDLVLHDVRRLEIINAEGKKHENLRQGIAQLRNLAAIEDAYIRKHYPDEKIIRTVILYGGEDEAIAENEVGFLLNKHGIIVLGVRTPRLFQEAIKNLRHYHRLPDSS